MTFSNTIYEIAIQIISNILSNLCWLIVLYWGFKTISYEIKQGVKEIPKWLKQYEEIRNRERAIDFARSRQ